MRIAVLTGEVPAATFIDTLIHGMAGRGYTMIVIGKKTKKFEYPSHVKVIAVPQTKAGQVLFVTANIFGIRMNAIRMIYKNAKSIRSFFNDLVFYLPLLKAKPDRVHVQWASMLHYSALLFDLFPGKIMLSLRGAHINYTPIANPAVAKSYRKVFPEVLKFHAVSSAIAEEATRYNADRGKISVIHTSVKQSILNSVFKEGTGEGPVNMIAIGRFHWVKGYNYLFDALAILKTSGVKFKLKLIAGKLLPEELMFSIHQNNLEENIVLIDSLPHSEVLEEISAADLMILPSVNEGIANVVIEAMALGTPVISSDCGGMGEVIDHGVNGFLFENRNPEDLAEKIRRFILLDQGTKDRIRENAKVKVLRDFSLERMLNEFEQFYA